MGKPYAGELEKLNNTYAWALEARVDGLATLFRASANSPLIAVGSGGSLTSAHLAALFHTHYTGRLARVMTPYELLRSPAHLGDLGVLMLSAGGSNPDVVTAFKEIAKREPAHLASLCMSMESPLAATAAAYPWSAILAFAPPVEKDGFLATNSLLATSVLLIRAYRQNWPREPALPASLDLLLHPGQSREEFLADLRRRCTGFWGRQTLLVLHGSETQPAAADLESKFSEAALGNLQVADYRNFGHGRHHWLARNGHSSAVLALAALRDAAVAEKTLALLPEDIPAVRLDFEEGMNGAIVAMVTSLYIAGLAGRAVGIDPGRPHVPTFGRKLYHLGIETSTSRAHPLDEREATAIERKACLSVPTLIAQGRLAEWRDAYQSFCSRIVSANFRAVVFDYDGTLCGPAERYEGPRAEITEHLLRLLRSGLLVGLATGRGKSIRKDLRDRIDSESLQRMVTVGYHNGAEIGTLDDDDQPPLAGAPDNDLARLVAALKAEPRIDGAVRIDAKNRQATLEFVRLEMASEIWDVVERAVREHASPGVSALRSSHSIDLLAPGVSKKNVVKRIRQETEFRFGGGDILCVGDRGCWPGNDFDLLRECHSLSVDEVSRDPETCWNLATPGSLCVEACLEYLAAMLVTPTGMKLSL